MKEDIILGCDIGTGSCKITACYANGEPVQEVHSYYTTQQPRPGYIMEDPVIIKNAFVDCLKKILHLLPASPVAMGFSSAMHSLMLVDGDNRPLTGLIVWEDNRSGEIARQLRNSPLGMTIYEKTGTPIHSMSPLCKIKWFHDHEPGLFHSTAKFIGIKEFLWYWMFHDFEVDISIGSATGLMNIQSLEWEKDSLEFCGITENKLSAIVGTSYTRTDPSEEFVKAAGAPPQMKYCIGASDGCLANYGSGADGTNKATLTIGTSGAVRVTSHKPIIHHQTMIFNYLLDKNMFICGGPVNNGGNVLLWLFKTFLGKEKPDADDYVNLENELSQIPAGAQGLVCLPWLLGERAPVWDESVSGVWMGVRSYHTPFHFFRAALEGICFNLRTILESMEEVSGPVGYLYAGGGFTRSAQWVQMMADITHKKVVVSQGADASALGAVLWTIHALGMKTNKVRNKNETIINPDKSTSEITDRHYTVFRDLYKNTAGQMHALTDARNSHTSPASF